MVYLDTVIMCLSREISKFVGVYIFYYNYNQVIDILLVIYNLTWSQILFQNTSDVLFAAWQCLMRKLNAQFKSLMF